MESIDLNKVHELSIKLQKNILNHLQPTEVVIFRLVKNGHECPFGLKALKLLQRRKFRVIDCHITNDEQNQEVKELLNVKTTPQIFIKDQHIGGYDALKEHFGMNASKADPNQPNYKPIITIFSITALMALFAGAKATNQLLSIQTLVYFVAFSMCFLAIKKLENLEAFTNGFLGYDLVAKKYIPYAYAYPFIEAFAGVAMLGNYFILNLLGSLSALFIGTVGALSVAKAVYAEERKLTCACVGGKSNVPLGLVSLLENITMAVVAFGMLIKVLFF